MFSDWTCGKKGCELTPLWQCGIDVTPRWALTAKPIKCILSLVLCGLCKDEVKLSDFNGFTELLQERIDVDVSDLTLTLVFYDISDGYWIDPNNPNPDKKVKIPRRFTM
jgi:hypothetical protein